jgi:hypothetical protein
MFADYQPNSGSGFRVQYADLNQVLIDALVEEILAVCVTTTTTTTIAP